MSPLRLVADDLTGALDSAAQFTGRFGRIPVLLGVPPAWPESSFAVDLNGREGSEPEAVSRALAAAPGFRDADIAFKKIDSLLRGHWAAELAAVAALDLFDRIVLAPAFPAQGRVTRGGRQLVLGDAQTWRVLPVEPVAELVRRGLVVDHETMEPHDAGRSPLVLLRDAECDDDLAALVRDGCSLPGHTLWCGSAGLARALASMPPARIAPSEGTHLVVVGSNHAVTEGQTAHIQQLQARCVIRFDEDAEASAARIHHVLARHGRCVATPELPADTAAADAAERISRGLHMVLPRVGRPGTLTVVGGETFAAVCRALDVDRLQVDGEWRPGIPASRLCGGPWTGTRCFSKSGAFGGERLLAELIGMPAVA